MSATPDARPATRGGDGVPTPGSSTGTSGENPAGGADPGDDVWPHAFRWPRRLPRWSTRPARSGSIDERPAERVVGRHHPRPSRRRLRSAPAVPARPSPRRRRRPGLVDRPRVISSFARGRAGQAPSSGFLPRSTRTVSPGRSLAQPDDSRGPTSGGDPGSPASRPLTWPTLPSRPRASRAARGPLGELPACPSGVRRAAPRAWPVSTTVRPRAVSSSGHADVPGQARPAAGEEPRDGVRYMASAVAAMGAAPVKLVQQA